MSARILWQSDTTLDQMSPTREGQEIMFANMIQFAKSVARPDTEFVIDFPQTNIGQHFAPFLKLPRAVLGEEIVGRVRQAEEEGFDAAFAGMCYGEFFLQDARQAVSMPVVGAAESAMMMAQLVGRKFAVVTVAKEFVHVMEENIRFHGWEDRAIRNRPVRYWEPDLSGRMLEAYAGRPERLIAEFDAQAQECVRDGADVVICACNPYGAALSQVGYNQVSGTGVPVVTPLPAMIKIAESLIDLRRSVGLVKTEAVVGPYRSTPAEVLEDMAAIGMGPKRYVRAAPMPLTLKLQLTAVA